MIPVQADAAPYVSLADITEIELIILKRMSDVTIGDHRSRSHGSGFDFVGLRDWQAGDRFSSIDWGQSTLTNFSPLVVREFEQPSTAPVVVLADTSLSTRCGAGGPPIAAAVARAIATIGMSAVFFQDPFGLVSFDTDFAHLGSLRPRTGKGQVMHCLDAYQWQRGLQPVRRVGDLRTTLGGYLRRTSMLPVVSDFLFDGAEAALRDLAFLTSAHDVFVVMVDATFAYEMPALAAGWVQVLDVETGRSRTISRGALAGLADKVRTWQAHVRRIARDLDLDVVDVGLDATRTDIALSEFVAERRLRKTRT
jgi:uncharacterized protein (DUF58 family)